jgi:hypothetical protein
MSCMALPCALTDRKHLHHLSFLYIMALLCLTCFYALLRVEPPTVSQHIRKQSRQVHGTFLERLAPSSVTEVIVALQKQKLVKHGFFLFFSPFCQKDLCASVPCTGGHKNVGSLPSCCVICEVFSLSCVFYTLWRSNRVASRA